jgi:Zn finger protein HypA/HybF involved in hydrogenase expression
MKEANLHKCKQCGNLVLRKLDGNFPSKNKKWVDEEGKLWRGKICPKCHRHNQKLIQAERRKKK